MQKGLLIILSGPSGVGKGTVRKMLVKQHKLPFAYSISMTTREKRPKETEGVDYFFVSNEEFQRNIDNDNFLEWTEFVGNKYGTPKDKVEEWRNAGLNVFLEIETCGAEHVMNVLKHDEGVISIFLMPPSLDKLEQRIRGRKSESEELIQQRLKKGIREMSLADHYDYVVINDNVKRAANKLYAILHKKLKSLR